MHQFNNDARFSLTLPGNWGEVEDGEDSVYTFAKTNDGVGSLQVSLAKKNIEEAPTEVECIKQLESYFGRQNLMPTITTSSTDFGFVGHAEATVSDNRFLAVWLFLNRQRFAFVTYNCPEDKKELEIKEVNEIVNTLLLL